MATLAKIEEFLNGLTRPTEKVLAIQKQLKSGAKIIIVNWDDVAEWDTDVARSLLENPDASLKVFCQEASAQAGRDVEVNIKNLPKNINIRKIGKGHAYKLIQLRGVVTAISSMYQLCVRGAWRCKKCKNITHVTYNAEPNMDALPPLKCTCKHRNFIKPMIFSESEYIDAKDLTVSEHPNDLPAGEIPESMSVILLGNRVDGPRAGDDVIIVGIVRLSQIRKNKFTPFVEANDIETINKESSKIVITDKEMKEIKKLAEDPKIYDKLAKSIAPSLAGLYYPKLAIIYSLFGGIRREKKDITVRGDIHVLLLGDIDTGKSDLLRAAKKIALRGVYTGGKGVSAAGLTAAAIKEQGGDKYVLHVGALPLADLGICFIDEIDKMDKNDRRSIHLAMEQQKIPINKGGINTELNTRCAIQSAANPIGGRYDVYKSIMENINLPSALLSRFDVIFIIRDIPTEDIDSIKADYIMGLTEDTGSIRPALIRKYIAYAKRIEPKFEKGGAASDILRFFWQEARKKDSKVPLGPRQLRGLVRIAEASARIRLSPTISEADAERAIDLWKNSIGKTALDVKTGKIDIDVIMTGKPKTVRDKYDAILLILSENGMIKWTDLIKEATKDDKMSKSDAIKIINQMKNDAIVYEPKQGYIMKT